MPVGAAAPVASSRFAGKSPAVCHPLFCCFNLIVSVAFNVLPEPVTVAFPVVSSVRAAACTSAYALLMFARSVASLAFSSCPVKIGILIATKTPMITTNMSGSVRRNSLTHYLKDEALRLDS
mgnify:CR=1 FL=1